MRSRWRSVSFTHQLNPGSSCILLAKQYSANSIQLDCLRSFDLEDIELEDPEPFEKYLTQAAYAIRSAYHTTLGFSPAQLVFGRDMFMPVTCNPDWETIRKRKQDSINKSNQRENKKRIDHKYQTGDLVTLERPGIIPKLSLPRQGPYAIVEAHANGTVTIQKEPTVTDRVNIRRVHPYYLKEKKPSRKRKR